MSNAPAMDEDADGFEDDAALAGDEHLTGTERLLRFADADGDISHLLRKDELAQLGQRVVDGWELDCADREDWKKAAEQALARAAQEEEDAKTYPFDGAARVNYPIITVATHQFAARAYPAIVKGDEAVRVKVIGGDREGKKTRRAYRVKTYLNYRLFYGMPDWEGDVDALLNQIPVIGMGFKKVHFDARLGTVSEYVSAMRLTVPKDTVSLDRCPRITHDFDLYPYEITSRQTSGVYRSDVTLLNVSEDEQEPHLVLEQHRLEDLDGDGVEEPYVVTVLRETSEVLRIEAAFSVADIGTAKDDDTKVVAVRRWQPFVAYPFLPDPKGRFYAIGFGQLLKGINEVINTAINQLLDAGHAQVAGGGFISQGLRLQGAGQASTIRWKPGEYKVVNSSAPDLRTAIYDRTIPNPSPVLFSLLDLVLGAAKDIASVKDVLTGDAPSTAPVGTTLALIEQGLQAFTSIYKRIYRAQREEFRKIYQCEARWGGADYLEVLDDDEANFEADFAGEGSDILPISDPTAVTRAQSLAKAQVLGTFMPMPFANQAEIMRYTLEAAEIEDANRFFARPGQPDPKALAEIAKTESEAERNRAAALKMTAEAGKITGEVVDPRRPGAVARPPGHPLGVPGAPDGGGGPEGSLGEGDLGGDALRGAGGSDAAPPLGA